MFKKLRVSALIYLLVLVAAGAWFTKVRSTDWDAPLWVLVYPINGDGSAVADAYMDKLERASFDPIVQFVAREAGRYGVSAAQPVSINLAARLGDRPPLPPREANPVSVAWWSLRLRYWAWRVQWSQSEPSADVQIFVLYHDPETSPVLPHSLGLQKGLIGVVHAFASRRMTASNNVIIAHELLHTVGASDKYDPRTNHPVFPDGYAEPQRKPLYPQPSAELMAGRRMVSETEALTPASLARVVVGPATAAEINWRRR